MPNQKHRFERILATIAAFAIGMAAASAARACPFCAATQQTLGEELQSTDAAVLPQLVKAPPPYDPNEDDGASYREVASRDIGTGTTQVNLRSSTLIGLAVSGGGTGSARGDFRAVSDPPFTPEPPAPPETEPLVVPLAEVAGISWDRLNKQRERSQVRVRKTNGDLLTFSGRMPDPPGAS